MLVFCGVPFVTPELFAQLASAVGGPGAVVFLWFWMTRQPGKDKVDPVQELAADLRVIKEALAEIEKGMAVLLDRRK
jgi:hypothetical protein